MKTAIYARVSTQKQEHEKTIESQLAELRLICKRDNCEITKEYIDNGWSGETLERPQLDALRDDAEKGLFESIYIYSPDRLGRDHIDQGLVLREWKKQEINVVFKDKPLTEDNKLTFDIESLLAEHEKRKILERTRRGRLHKAKQGLVVGATPPYGYDYIEKTKTAEGHYVINKKEARIVNQIFDLYAGFQSIERTTKELNARKVEARSGKWSNSTIGKILRREDYIGNYYYGKGFSVEPEEKKTKYSKVIKTSRRIKNKEEWIGPIKVPVIVDKGKFDLVQRLLENHSKPFAYKTHFYLLSGLGILRCGDCGSTIQADNTRGYSYYRCRKCGKMIPVEEIDKPVWGEVSKAMENPQILQSRIKDLNQNGDKTQELLNEEKKELIAEALRIRKQQGGLLDLYAERDIEKDVLLEKTSELGKTKKEIEKKVKEIEARVKQIDNKAVVIESLAEFTKMNKKQFKTFKPEQKRELLKILLDEILYSPLKGKIQSITGCIPTAQSDRALSIPLI